MSYPQPGQPPQQPYPPYGVGYTTAAPPSGGTGAIVAAVAVGLWTALTTLVVQSGTWLFDSSRVADGHPLPHWIWTASGLVNAVLVAAPAVLIAKVPRSKAVRATGRVWLLGAAVLAGLALARLVAPAEHELYLAVLGALALLGGVVLRLGRRRAAMDRAQSAGQDPASTIPQQRGGYGLGVTAGAVVGLPWLWFGAAGGLLETVLAVLAAAAVGWLARGLLDERFWAPFAALNRGKRLFVTGLGAGVALMLLGAGTGNPGVQLPLLALLPALGFAVAALRTTGAGVATVVALGVLGPLAMLDGQEVTLILLGKDVPLWALLGGLLGTALAWLVGLVYWAGARPSLPRWVGVGTAAITVVAAAGVYFGAGQPGLYGDRLFVILKDQAPLSGLPTATGAAAHGPRVRAVYQRLVEFADRTQADLRRDLRSKHLGFTPYYLVNAVEVDAGPTLRPWLESRPDVDRVLLSPQLRPLPEPPSTDHGSEHLTGLQWNIQMVHANEVWLQGVTGKGITVGSADSGVDGTHAALADGFRGGDDSWYDPWNHSRTPQAHAGHGTHTLATAVGNGGVGVAPDATWVGCVNLDRNLGNPARYLDCLQFMLAPFPYGGNALRDGHPERAPQVLTNSWGCPELEGCDLEALHPATLALAAAGVFFVAAAGNSGPSCSSIDDAPAPYADVFSVGAVDRNREITSFSSRGPGRGGSAKPDLVAPGAQVLSAMPGGGYAKEDGTSMAAPHVAGVVALLWSARPELIGDVAATQRLLRQTATPLTVKDDCGDPQRVVGAGLVNAAAAVKAARKLPLLQAR